MEPHDRTLSATLLWLFMQMEIGRAQKPIQAKWSNTSIGPDGPWPAIEMTMGGVQDIALYPGGAIYRTHVIVKGYCTTGNTPCFASNAGLYNPGAGGDYNASNFSTPDITYGDSVKGYSLTWGFDIDATKRYSTWFDSVWLDHTPKTRTPNIWLGLIDEGRVKLAGGSEYPLFAGCVTFGGAYPSGGGPAATVGNEVSIAGQLYGSGKIPTNSVGMHLGSTVTVPEPSLYLGGYDQTRVLGSVLVSPGGIGPVNRNIRK